MRHFPSSGMGLFSLVWLTQLISSIGTTLTGFTLGVDLFQETGSVTHFGLLGAAMGLPNVLLSPLAGLLVDRYSRRKILMLSHGGSGLCSLALFCLILRDDLSPSGIYLLMGLSASFGTLLWPAFTAATTLMVRRQDLGRASGMTQIGVAISQALALSLAGILLSALGLHGVLLIDVATFSLALTVLAWVRLPELGERQDSAAPGSWRKEIFFGWRFIRARPGLWHLLLIFAALNFCFGGVQTLLTPLILSFSTPTDLGRVLALATGGMLAGGFLITFWGGPHRRVPLILILMTGQGLLLLLGGLEPSLILVATVAFFFLFAFPIIVSCSQVIWQSKVPPELQGRVFSFRALITTSTLPLTQALVGPVADLFETFLTQHGPLAGTVGQLIGVGPGRGTGLLFMLFGLLLLAFTALAAGSPHLRRLEDELPDATVPAHLAPEASTRSAG